MKRIGLIVFNMSLPKAMLKKQPPQKPLLTKLSDHTNFYLLGDAEALLLKLFLSPPGFDLHRALIPFTGQD